MPNQLPRSELRDALRRAGVPVHRQNRRALRGLVHALTGLPPADQTPADDLARRLLALHASGTIDLEEALWRGVPPDILNFPEPRGRDPSSR